MQKEEKCAECYAIRCRQCGWQADDEAIRSIQAGSLTACPECGWKPGEDVTA